MIKASEGHSHFPKGVLLDIFNAVLGKIAACEPGATPDRLAYLATTGIKEKIGGQCVYIPMDRAGKIKSRNNELYDFWKNSNESIQQIALRFDVSQGYVYDIISKNSRASGLTGKKLLSFRKERNEKIHEAWKSGATTSELVRDFGVAHSSIRQIIQSFTN